MNKGIQTDFLFSPLCDPQKCSGQIIDDHKASFQKGITFPLSISCHIRECCYCFLKPAIPHRSYPQWNVPRSGYNPQTGMDSMFVIRHTDGLKESKTRAMEKDATSL